MFENEIDEFITNIIQRLKIFNFYYNFDFKEIRRKYSNSEVNFYELFKNNEKMKKFLSPDIYKNIFDTIIFSSSKISFQFNFNINNPYFIYKKIHDNKSLTIGQLFREFEWFNNHKNSNCDITIKIQKKTSYLINSDKRLYRDIIGIINSYFGLNEITIFF
jgi:hypothetical protein